MKKEPILISFKVSEDVAKMLESLTNGESIHLVAKRIVLDSIGKVERKTPVEERLFAVETQLAEIKKLCP